MIETPLDQDTVNEDTEGDSADTASAEGFESAQILPIMMERLGTYFDFVWKTPKYLYSHILYNN